MGLFSWLTKKIAHVQQSQSERALDSAYSMLDTAKRNSEQDKQRLLSQYYKESKQSINQIIPELYALIDLVNILEVQGPASNSQNEEIFARIQRIRTGLAKLMPQDETTKKNIAELGRHVNIFSEEFTAGRFALNIANTRNILSNALLIATKIRDKL